MRSSLRRWRWTQGDRRRRVANRRVPISASNAAFLSVMAGITVQKVDVAQWVDDIAFLYMDIRLRHQRNKTTVGRWFLYIS
jgi:hypothetical protein